MKSVSGSLKSGKEMDTALGTWCISPVGARNEFKLIDDI